MLFIFSRRQKKKTRNDPVTLAEQIQGHIGYKDVEYLEEFVNDATISAKDIISKEDKDHNISASTEDSNNSSIGSYPSTNGYDNSCIVSPVSNEKSKNIKKEVNGVIVGESTTRSKKNNNRSKKNENKGKGEEKSTEVKIALTADVENAQDISASTKESKFKASSPTDEANTSHSSNNSNIKPKKNKKKHSAKSSKASTPAPETITSPIESPEKIKTQTKQMSLDENDAEDEGEIEDEVIGKFFALKKNSTQSGRIININISNSNAKNTINTLIDDEDTNFHTASDSETFDKDFVTIQKYSKKKKRAQYSQKTDASGDGYKSSAQPGAAAARGYESEREYNPNRNNRRSSFASQTYSSSMYTISKAGENNRHRGGGISSTATSKSDSINNTSIVADKNLTESDHLMLSMSVPVVEESAEPKMPSYADIAKAARAAKAAAAAAAVSFAKDVSNPPQQAKSDSSLSTTSSLSPPEKLTPFAFVEQAQQRSTGDNNKPVNCVAGGGSKRATKPAAVATSSVVMSSVGCATNITVTSSTVTFVGGGERVHVATSSQASLSSVSLPSAFSSSSSSSPEGKCCDHTTTVPVITQKDANFGVASSVVAFSKQLPPIVSFESKMSTSSNADKFLSRVSNKNNAKMILGKKPDDANFSPVTFDENIVPNGKEKIKFGDLNIKFFEDGDELVESPELSKPSSIAETPKVVCCFVQIVFLFLMLMFT